MTALLTNQELGIPDDATPEQRAVALKAAYIEHFALKVPNCPPAKENENARTQF